MTVKRKGTSLRNELSAHLRACHPREGGASQPHLDDFAAMSSSENVRYLKKSFATIKRHLKPFKALEKGYSRNLHGFFDHIKTFVQRLDDVIVFLDSENKVPTHQDVINFLQQRRDVAAAHGRGRCAPSANEKEVEFLLELEACQQTLARLGERLRGIVPVEGVWNHLLMLVRD